MIAIEADQVLATLVTDYLDRRATRDKITAELDEITEQILSRVPVGGKIEVTPGQGIRVQGPSNRFNLVLARTMLTNDQLASISIPTPSVELAREVLPGALVRQLSTPVGQPSVRPL